MRLPPVEILVAATILAAACVAIKPQPTPAYEGQVVEIRHYVDRATGEAVVAITVGWRTDPEHYEQFTTEYPAHSRAAIFLKRGSCVTVRPVGEVVRLSPCP